ncbi:MAG: ATP-binding cassette domain-containing protein [bacterium]|nr:ATP-binding cassette domain-containing protein [bacterium]
MPSKDASPVLEFLDVSKVFGRHRVIDHQTFTVYAGEIFVIIGPSGTGKSVSLKLASGQLMPTEGDVRVLGTSLVDASTKTLEALRQRMGYLFQSGALLGWKTLRENVALPLEVRGKMKPKAIAEAVTKALEDVGLGAAGDRYPAEVSGGMVKRAAFARAIVEHPELLFFDEPTSGLDPVMARTIDDLITQINQKYGAACVVVTHDLAGALRYAHRIAFLKEGRFLEVSTPQAILSSQQPDIQAFLAAQSMEAKDVTST